MDYSDFRVHFNETKRDFIDAFVMVLGEKYRDQITKNINRVLFLDFITMDQLENYLDGHGILKENSKSYLRDMVVKREIRKKYFQKFLEQAMALIPGHPVLLSEEEKILLDPYYETPLFHSLLGKEENFIVKSMILERLGHRLEIQKPYRLHQEENDKCIDLEWNRLFSPSETHLLGDVSKKLEEDMKREIFFHTGTIEENQTTFDLANTLINGSFDYLKILNNPKARYAVFNVDLNSKKILPVFVFSPISVVNEYLLFSFVEELSRVISMMLLRFDEKVFIKMGVMELHFSRGVDIYDDDALLQDRPEVVWEFEKRASFNDAIVQYISNLVCHTILENGLCKNLFSFQYPEQKCKFEGNLMFCFKEFFERHFSSIKRCYMGDVVYERIGNVSFDELVAISNVVSKNYEAAVLKKKLLDNN